VGYLTFWRFVAAQVIFGFGENDAAAQFRAVLFQRQLVRRVHGIFGRVINPFAGFFADESDNFAFVTFFCHIYRILTGLMGFVNGAATGNRTREPQLYHSCALPTELSRQK
jgi:hypothetical protein